MGAQLKLAFFWDTLDIERDWKISLAIRHGLKQRLLPRKIDTIIKEYL